MSPCLSVWLPKFIHENCLLSRCTRRVKSPSGLTLDSTYSQNETTVGRRSQVSRLVRSFDCAKWARGWKGVRQSSDVATMRTNADEIVYRSECINASSSTTTHGINPMIPTSQPSNHRSSSPPVLQSSITLYCKTQDCTSSTMHS